jgi:hypothetical protein
LTSARKPPSRFSSRPVPAPGRLGRILRELRNPALQLEGNGRHWHSHHSAVRREVPTSIILSVVRHTCCTLVLDQFRGRNSKSFLAVITPCWPCPLRLLRQRSAGLLSVLGISTCCFGCFSKPLQALEKACRLPAASTPTRGRRGIGQSACSLRGACSHHPKPHSPRCHAAWLLGGSSGTSSGAHFRRKKTPSGEGMARVVPAVVRVCRLARDGGCEARVEPKECNSAITLPALALEISVNILSISTLDSAPRRRTAYDGPGDGRDVELVKDAGGLGPSSVVEEKK